MLFHGVEAAVMNEHDDDDDDEMPICDDVCCARCRFPLQQPMNIITLVFLKHWSLITHWDKDQKKFYRTL